MTDQKRGTDSQHSTDEESPPRYKAHLFVCTHSRETGESCGPKGGGTLRDSIKRNCKGAGVRINASGCLGHCERGITAVLYPQGKWFFGLRPDAVSLERLQKSVEDALDHGV